MMPEQRSAIIQSVLFLFVAGAILFGTAGRIDIWNFWMVLAIYALVFVVSLVVIDDDLIRERMRPGGGRAPVAPYLATLVLLVELALAGLDRGRLHWSDGVTPGLMILGLVLFALGDGLTRWAMWVNRYFSSAVRLQQDRGQSVISRGPYAWVRHPGYAGALLLIPGSGLALGSWIALAVALLPVPWLVWRTVGEDRMLRTGLDGYADYARRVRWRIVPGLW